MPLCSVTNCGALVPAGGDTCVVHAKGYRRHDGSKPLLCQVCMFEFSKGDWYVIAGEDGAQCAGPHRKRKAKA